MMIEKLHFFSYHARKQLPINASVNNLWAVVPDRGGDWYNPGGWRVMHIPSGLHFPIVWYRVSDAAAVRDKLAEEYNNVLLSDDDVTYLRKISINEISASRAFNPISYA